MKSTSWSATVCEMERLRNKNRYLVQTNKQKTIGYSDHVGQVLYCYLSRGYSLIDTCIEQLKTDNLCFVHD